MSLHVTRRRFVTLAGLATVGVATGACATADQSDPSPAVPTTTRDPSVPTLTAGVGEVVIGGTTVTTWRYGESVPGPALRVTAGDTLRIRLRNELPAPTTVHWHGIALRNEMDGVPNLTQPVVEPGSEFLYEFVAPDPGTYFFHPHVGVQLDRGLYAPLIVEDPNEPGGYDLEVVVVLDDWLDGFADDADSTLERLLSGMDMGEGSMDHGGMDMGDDAASAEITSPYGGDVAHPVYLINGRDTSDPTRIPAKPGQRVRFRLINAAADTAFRIALSKHRVTVTHTDGFPVDPVDVDTLIIGMGERIDCEVTLGTGAFPLVAVAEGKTGSVAALVETAPESVDLRSGVDVLPELSGRLLGDTDLVAREAVRLQPRRPDRIHKLILEGDMMSYRWTINGEVFSDSAPLDAAAGERVRLEFENRSQMFHPMHLHGHTFQVSVGEEAGPRKDTVVVLPGRATAVDFDADNAGAWAIHCHNIYHAEAGMMTVLRYT